MNEPYWSLTFPRTKGYYWARISDETEPDCIIFVDVDNQVVVMDTGESYLIDEFVNEGFADLFWTEAVTPPAEDDYV